MPSRHLYVCVALGTAWWLLAIVLHGRDHFLLNYSSLRIVPPMSEPFMSSYSINAMAIGIMFFWVYVVRRLWTESNEARRSAINSQILLAISMLPLLAWGAEILGLEFGAKETAGAAHDGWVSLWNVYWFVGWSGLSFARLGGWILSERSWMSPERSWMAGLGLVVCVSLVIAAWWVWQSHHYYQSFMLGFNDFGHFMQRVSNTANGHGFLLETPVLPIFWDHFNPGLVLLVPLWNLYPDVTLAFYLQAAALAVSSWGIWFIARGLGLSPKESVCWSLAWLCQPILGQMNLAYTYGWHPISLAIPLLLFAIACLQRSKWWWATLLTIAALSMEEGVFVIVATFCASNFWLRFRGRSANSLEQSPQQSLVNSPVDSSVPNRRAELSWKVWLGLSVCASIGFVLVFKLSGLAEFQTARFASLGGTPLEVVASPILKPSLFWGQLISNRNAYFVLGLTLSCFLPALILGWRTAWACVPPIAVLIVWEHRPAASLAFQYSSILLPVLWLASMQGSRRDPWFAFTRKQIAFGACATSFLFSLYLGQFPFSSRTLSDVRASSYSSSLAELSPEGDSPTTFPREAGSLDGNWIHEQLKIVRESHLEVLATGRIASHLLGNREVETVGQFELRREKLALLPNRSGPPIRHYRWLVVDRMETFQQTQDQTKQVEQEALQNGFVKLQERFGVAIYRNDAGF